MDIDGPTTLNWDEEDEFYADTEGGWTPYSNYQWWWRIFGGGIPDGKGGGINAPPPGEWEYLSGLEGQSTIVWGFSTSFELKCIVWDRGGNNYDVDYHFVTVTQN